MFVRKSKYDALVATYNACVRELKLRTRQRDRADRIAEQAMMDAYEAHEAAYNAKNNSGFTSEDLKHMRRMLHPDRNGGSEIATRLTQKINGMLK